jgi:myosin heavy subunit
VLLGSHENKIHDNNQYQCPYISNFNAEEGDEKGATEGNPELPSESKATEINTPKVSSCCLSVCLAIALHPHAANKNAIYISLNHKIYQMCCPNNILKPMEEDPAVSTESRKRMKRRGGSSISRHQQSGNAKSVKPGAVPNTVPNQAMSFAEPPPNVVTKQPTQAQKLKSVRKRLENQKVNSSKMEKRLAESKDKLLVANDRITDLQQANKSLSNKTAALKNDADKSASLLSSRTERFVEFHQRKEEEIKRVKARAEKKVLWLEKQHGLAISKIESKMY